MQFGVRWEGLRDAIGLQKTRRPSLPLPSMVELGQWYSGWLVVPSVGCFPCREEKRPGEGASGKRRDSQNGTNSNQDLKKTSSSGLLDDPVCALVEWRAVLCVWCWARGFA